MQAGSGFPWGSQNGPVHFPGLGFAARVAVSFMTD